MRPLTILYNNTKKQIYKSFSFDMLDMHAIIKEGSNFTKDRQNNYII